MASKNFIKIVFSRLNVLVDDTCRNVMQGFIQDFQFGGGGDVVCGLTEMGEYTVLQVTPRNGANSIVVSVC